MSRPIFRMTPMCSSLLRSEYFSSLPGGFPLWAARYVSSEAFDNTTIKRFVSLSFDAIGTCCSAMSRGSSGGGRDCVPVGEGESKSKVNEKSLKSRGVGEPSVAERFLRLHISRHTRSLSLRAGFARSGSHRLDSRRYAVRPLGGMGERGRI